MTSNFDRTLRHCLRDVIKTGFVVERPIYLCFKNDIVRTTGIMAMTLDLMLHVKNIVEPFDIYAICTQLYKAFSFDNMFVLANQV